MQVIRDIKDKMMRSHNSPMNPTATTIRSRNGCPFGDAKHSLTAGPNGPVVVTDVQLYDKILSFNREKIPARNVHALGCGCYGTLTITNDVTRYTKADLFSSVGKKTDLFCRFSGIFTEQGDADTHRDPRGFALKFYTNQGNWDLMGINTPVFSVRDMKVGPDNVHAFKRDPRDGCWNDTMRWDYVATHPEGLHQVMMVYTDRIGTPASYRMMDGYGCHTFSMINSSNKRVWVKYHIKSLQCAAGFTNEESKIIAGEDPNFLSKDLEEAIKQGKYPKYRLMMQVMEEEAGYTTPYAFDPTKVWKHDDHPLIEIGIIEMNRNPVNYFSEVEQVAFQPTNLVPGLGLSPDRLLGGRLLVYAETQHHRIGANYFQLQVNRPLKSFDNTYGGGMNTEIKDKFPHYHPSIFGNKQVDPTVIEPPLKVDGPVDFYPLEYEDTDQDYYSQVRDFYRILSPQDRDNLCENLASSFMTVKEHRVIDAMIKHLSKVDDQFGHKVEIRLHEKREYRGMTRSEEFVSSVRQDLLSK